jgi:hypothetical protein
MNKPRFGETNLGAIVGAAVGSICGLFAVGVAPAMLDHDLKELFTARNFGLAGFIVSAPVGWLIGGQLSPRLEHWFGERVGSIVGGTIGGLVPVVCIALWSWYLVTRH